MAESQIGIILAILKFENQRLSEGSKADDFRNIERALEVPSTEPWLAMPWERRNRMRATIFPVFQGEDF